MAGTGNSAGMTTMGSAPPKPWWTSNLDNFYRQLQNSNQKCIRNDTEKNRKLFKEAQKKYITAVQGHQAAYTANFVQMVQYCPAGQFWQLRQHQQTSFALPITPLTSPQGPMMGGGPSLAQIEEWKQEIGELSP